MIFDNESFLILGGRGVRIPIRTPYKSGAQVSHTKTGNQERAGFTDIIDGFVARKLKQESDFGAKLDSIADFIFAIVILIFIVKNIEIPIWLWVCILSIAVLRFVCYGIGFYKYHSIAPLHTYANKISGALIFMAPVLYSLFGLLFTGGILCVVAFVSALEEMIITIKSKEPNRDCKGIIFKMKARNNCL